MAAVAATAAYIRRLRAELAAAKRDKYEFAAATLRADHARVSVKTWQKNGCQAFEIKLRPSRRREAGAVTTMTASSSRSSSRSDGHHSIAAALGRFVTTTTASSSNTPYACPGTPEKCGKCLRQHH